MKIVIASGYFNPIHKGHIEYLFEASALGQRLFVIVNNDEQVALKGTVPFMDIDERMDIVSSLNCVDEIFKSIDSDETVCNTIAKIVKDYCEFKEEKTQFIFAKGGDRNSTNIPEKPICDAMGVEIVDGLGKKIQSSSELINKAKEWKTK